MLGEFVANISVADRYQPAERVLAFDGDGVNLLGKKTAIKLRLLKVGLHAGWPNLNKCAG